MTDDRVQELLDKREIEEVVGGRYARALDWLDVDALKDCFWSDGWVDYGFFEGNAHEWCDVVMPIESSSIHRFHYVFNFVVELDGDRAHAESNSFAGSRRTKGSGEDIEQTFHGSRYLDTVERRDGRWRIAERRVMLEMTQRFPSPSGPGGALGGLELVADLGPDHPLYR
ncbi:MAG: nuclear transport factor 2 family protein, partial [Acidimicrobiales bacterium]